MKTLQELMNLRGRTALITGGAGHIGSAMASALAELGCRIAVVDLHLAAAQTIADALAGQHGIQTAAFAADMADEGAVRSLPDDVVRGLGGLDIVVHSAAYVGTTSAPGWATPFEQQSVAAWDAALRVNLTSAFTLVQASQRALAASGHGSVILISSIYGMVGPDMSLYEGTTMANPAGYNASKGGLLQLTRYLATVLSPQIRVNGISPGGVWRNQPETFAKRYAERTPLKRMATEEDFKGAVGYLASDLSAYVTGQNLVVDGGWTAW